MHPSFKWVLSKTPLPHYISIQTVPTNFLKSEGIGKVAEILQLSLVGSLVSFLFAKNVALSFSRRLSSVFDSRK